VIIDSKVKKKKCGNYLCSLEIVYDSKQMPEFGRITYDVERYFKTQKQALAFYCLKLYKENRFDCDDLPLANRNSNIKLSPRKYVEYLEYSREVFPELWI
jgi:hypothetical protein